ncbi:MAG: 2-C-methyl-D-erythritol 2,4-cyclodiphosphate synthase [Clostridia bacterium]|nr:2-C-methyl-D-erythritol 2,4-cyclodiphosphate synthase [Clostridia bacterium]
MNEIKICAVVCAAGKGSRTSFEKNKLLVPFLGSCALLKTLSAFDFPAVDEILVAASKEDFDEISALCKGIEKARVVLGGQDRSHSVYNALKATDAEIVLIHDGARPFVSREIIEGCIHSVKTYGSGVAAIPCTDTIAVVANEKIRSVPSREGLRQIQTPQGFFRENLLAAYERAFEDNEQSFTDDSSVFLRYCGTPRLCEGSVENKKLTYAEDFHNQTARCGFGVDTHAFGRATGYIVLGGVKIPSESGLIAHSDGDVLIHAVMDAMLSAAGLKDIGHYFPDSDPQFKNADSTKLLERVVTLLDGEGYGIKNLSVAILAERPRLAKYIDEMKLSLSRILRIDPTAVGISAGTNEGLGYIGEGKGITVHAYVLLKRI